jgi:modulator of FtsH protease
VAADLSEWDAFFTAQMAASATLAGLLFVGLSLNLSKILADRSLPHRALANFCGLLAILVVSSLVLLPGQSLLVLGTEILVAGLALWAIITWLDVAALRRSDRTYRKHFIQHFFLFQLAAVPYLIGGGVLLTRTSAGLYWVAAAVMLSLVATFFEAWIMLVEINR